MILAAERLTAANAKWDEDYEASGRDDDERELGRMMLKELDETPVDLKWIKAIGGRLGRSKWIEHPAIQIRPKDGAIHFNGNRRGKGEIPTRGQVRTYCRLNGIEITP